MSCRKMLIQIEYYYDDETGINKVGEVDFGYGQELYNYIKQYGLEGRNALFQVFGSLSYTIQDLFLQTHKPDIGSCPAKTI